MATKGSPDVGFVILEGRRLDNITTSMNHKVSQVLDQTDGLRAVAEEHSPVGQYMYESSIEGFYNLGTGLAQEGLELTGNQVLMYALFGNVIGDEFIGIDGPHGSISTLMERGKLHRVKADFKASVTTAGESTGPVTRAKDVYTAGVPIYVSRGMVQAGLQTVTAVGPANLATLDWAPAITPASPGGSVFGAGQVVDAGWDLSLGEVGMIAVASGGNYGHVTGVNDATDTVLVTAWVGGIPVNGETVVLHLGNFTDQEVGEAVGFLGVTDVDIDGAGDILFEIQDSADDAAYVNLIVFTVADTAGGVTGERVSQVAGAGAAQIERFTQLQYEFQGVSGVDRTCTFACGLVRRHAVL